MTPQELISTLKQLHEAATPEPWHTDKNRHPTTDGLPWGWLAWKRHEAGGYPANIPGLTCHWEGKQGRANAELLKHLRNELPRIIRLLEAGEMVSQSLGNVYREFQNQETIIPNDPISEARAALSAYEEAGK